MNDYPLLRTSASLSPCTNPCHHPHCARWRESRQAVDEIDRLRLEVVSLRYTVRNGIHLSPTAAVMDND